MPIEPATHTERNVLVEQNMGLVHACANRFRGRGTDYDDLFQAGCIGLIKAADNFDVTLGFSFSTYAVPAILGEIRRIFRDGGSVKLGRALKERSRNAMRVKETLTNELGQEPTIGELAARLGVEVAEAAELLNASMPTLSLTSQEEEGGGQWDIPIEPPDEAVSDHIALREVMRTLEERDRILIELRYFKGMTQSKAAAILGMSQVQVSRREKVILGKMRQNLSA